MGITSLFSAPGSSYLNNTVKSLQIEAYLVFLLKQELTIVAGRQTNNQSSQSLYTSGKAYGKLVLQATLPWARGLSAWLVLFLENVLPLQ